MSCSVTTVAPEARSFQPFECSVCKSRFTRHENLKRHAALHVRSADSSLSCNLCNATFSRTDLRIRHMKRQHPEVEVQRHRNLSVTSSGSSKRRKRARGDSPSVSPIESCDSSLPRLSDDTSQREPIIENWDSYSSSLPQSSRPEPNGSETVISEDDSLAPKVGSWSCPWIAATETTFASSLADFNFNQWSPDVVFANQHAPQQDEWYPSESQIAQGCHLFFEHIANFLPFLHQPTFNANETSRALLLGMLALAYQYGEDPDRGNKESSGQTLSLQCFYRARTFVAVEEESVDEALHGLTLVQAYLLLEVFALMYASNEDSPYGLKTHSKMISVARAAGLMQPAASSSTSCVDLDSLWHTFAQTESTKRTIFAIHQIDTLFYQFLSIPRSLSHLEIKHELPCPEVFFTATSSQDWAHKQLCKKQAGSTIAYTDAVRRLLSDTHLNDVSDFDPYGAINITHFLLSSAREQSGWSSMTGMLSMDRIEPLRASLLALSPYICPQKPDSARSPSDALREATWETAMIEMQMWSPSHTGGIIANSLDAAAHQMIGMAPTYDLLCKAKIASTIQSHVDWFLRYLDTTVVPNTEAPWLILYAFKAFMIAWQLMKGGAEGCMQAVGVRDGDREEALVWAKKVFERRARWKLGMTILACLDKLQS